MDVPGFEERGRQTGRLSRRRTEGMRTDSHGPNASNLSDGVMSRRRAGCAAQLGKTASLPSAAQHTLRAFWTSCRLRRMDQSIPR